MTELELEQILLSGTVLNGITAAIQHECDLDVDIGAQSFEEVGLLTENRGIILLIDGKEFELTIVER